MKKKFLYCKGHEGGYKLVVAAATCPKLLDYWDRGSPLAPSLVLVSRANRYKLGFVWTTDVDVDDSELAEFGGDRLSLQVEVLT